MNILSFRRVVLAAALALATAPFTLSAQQTESQQPAGAEELESWFAEYEEVHDQLQSIQEQALQDPELNSIQEQIGTQIRAAMETHDPSIADRIARAQSLESELNTAQQSGDVARLQELMSEVRQIEEHFITVQQAVMEQPTIATQITAFQTRLERKMGELNPGAPALIARFKELESKIEAAMRAGA